MSDRACSSSKSSSQHTSSVVSHANLHTSTRRRRGIAVLPVSTTHQELIPDTRTSNSTPNSTLEHVTESHHRIPHRRRSRGQHPFTARIITKSSSAMSPPTTAPVAVGNTTFSTISSTSTNSTSTSMHQSDNRNAVNPQHQHQVHVHRTSSLSNNNNNNRNRHRTQGRAGTPAVLPSPLQSPPMSPSRAVASTSSQVPWHAAISQAPASPPTPAISSLHHNSRTLPLDHRRRSSFSAAAAGSASTSTAATSSSSKSQAVLYDGWTPISPQWSRKSSISSPSPSFASGLLGLCSSPQQQQSQAIGTSAPLSTGGHHSSQVSTSSPLSMSAVLVPYDIDLDHSTDFSLPPHTEFNDGTNGCSKQDLIPEERFGDNDDNSHNNDDNSTTNDEPAGLGISYPTDVLSISQEETNSIVLEAAFQCSISPFQNHYQQQQPTVVSRSIDADYTRENNVDDNEGKEAMTCRHANVEAVQDQHSVISTQDESEEITMVKDQSEQLQQSLTLVSKRLQEHMEAVDAAMATLVVKDSTINDTVNGACVSFDSNKDKMQDNEMLFDSASGERTILSTQNKNEIHQQLKDKQQDHIETDANQHTRRCISPASPLVQDKVGFTPLTILIDKQFLTAANKGYTEEDRSPPPPPPPSASEPTAEHKLPIVTDIENDLSLPVAESDSNNYEEDTEMCVTEVTLNDVKKDNSATMTMMVDSDEEMILPVVESSYVGSSNKEQVTAAIEMTIPISGPDEREEIPRMKGLRRNDDDDNDVSAIEETIHSPPHLVSCIGHRSNFDAQSESMPLRSNAADNSVEFLAEQFVADCDDFFQRDGSLRAEAHKQALCTTKTLPAVDECTREDLHFPRDDLGNGDISSAQQKLKGVRLLPIAGHRHHHHRNRHHHNYNTPANMNVTGGVAVRGVVDAASGDQGRRDKGKVLNLFHTPTSAETVRVATTGDNFKTIRRVAGRESLKSAAMIAVATMPTISENTIMQSATAARSAQGVDMCNATTYAAAQAIAMHRLGGTSNNVGNPWKRQRTHAVCLPLSEVALHCVPAAD